jgi:hypothetical protein
MNPRTRRRASSVSYPLRDTSTWRSLRTPAPPLVGLVVLFLATRAADRSADLRTVFTWIGLLAAAGLAAYIVIDAARSRAGSLPIGSYRF